MAKGLTTADLHEILNGSGEGGYLVKPSVIDGSGEVAEMSAEQMFLAGTALNMIGARLIKDAKAAMLPRYRGKEGKQVRGRLVVQWSPGGPTVSLVREGGRGGLSAGGAAGLLEGRGVEGRPQD